VDGAALGITRAGNQAGLFQDLDVLGDGLLGDREGFGELVDARIAAREAGDQGASDGVGEGQEGAIERVVGISGRVMEVWSSRRRCLSTSALIN
jgi:hypothetical protein